MLPQRGACSAEEYTLPASLRDPRPNPEPVPPTHTQAMLANMGVKEVPEGMLDTVMDMTMVGVVCGCGTMNGGISDDD